MPGLRMKSLLLLSLVLAILEFDQSASAFLPEHQSASSLLSGRARLLRPSDDVITPADNLVGADGDDLPVTWQDGDHLLERNWFGPASGAGVSSHLRSQQPLAVTGDPAEVSGRHADLGRASEGPSRRQSLPGEDADFQSNYRGDEMAERLERVADSSAWPHHNGPSAIYEDSYHPAEDGPSAGRYTRHHETPTIQQRDAKSDITSFGLPRDTKRFEDDFTQPRDHEYSSRDDGGAVYNRPTPGDGSDTYNQPAAASESRDGDGEKGFMGGNIHQSLMAKIQGASAHAFDGAGNHGRLDFGPSSGTKGAEGADTAPSYKPVYEAPSRQPDPRPHGGERPSRAQDTGERDYEANGPGNDHRGNGGYQDDTVNHGQEPSQSQDYRGQDGSQGEDYRGEDYQGERYRGEDYRGEDYGGEDYRDEGYGGEEGRRGGYASFDPYKEAVQEEEAYRAVEGEADRYGQYSRSQGGTRHSDDEQSTAYPSRYQEAAMYRGYDGNRGYQEDRDYGSRQDRSRHNERGGYHGNRDSHSVDANRAHDFGRQKRDLGNSEGLVIFTEQVRNIHPVIHRHFEGIPPPTKGTPSQVTGSPSATTGIHPGMTIFRADVPPHSLIAWLAHIPPRGKDHSGIVEKDQQTVYVAPQPSAHAQKALMKLDRGQTLLNQAKTTEYAAEGAVQTFSPGVIHTGFVPMIPVHHISKRSLNHPSDLHVTSDDLAVTSKPAEGQKIVTSRDSVATPRGSVDDAKSATAKISGGFTIDYLPVTSADLAATSADLAVTSGDLLPAGSERRTAYQRQYTGYGGQQSRQSSASEPDPYERYLPREDDNDPYFRYAPRDSIQHSHDHEQSVRTEEGSHNQYDLYGRPQRNSRKRRPQEDNDYIDYDGEDYHSLTRQDNGYPSYGDFDEDYSSPPNRNSPRKHLPEYEYDDNPKDGYHGNNPSDYDYPSNGRRGNHRGSEQRYQEDEPSEDYEDSNRRRGKNKRRGATPIGASRGGVQTFSPGVIQTGFVPLVSSSHHVSRRSLNDLPENHLATRNLVATQQNGADGNEPVTSNGQEHDHDSLTSGGLAVTSDGLPVIPGDLPATSVDLAVTSGDLLPAGSERRTAYQRQYTGYDDQRSRQSSASEPDPYERYLPREDDNDPYFRYAPRDSIQHSHDHEQSVRTEEGSHNQYDLYGRPQRNSYKKGPRQEDGYVDYDDEDYHGNTRQEGGYPSYDDYDDDYSKPPSRNPPRKRLPGYEYDDHPDSGYHDNDPSGYDYPSNGRRGNRRGSGQRYQEDEPSEDYEYDQAEDYEDDDGDKYESRNRRRGHGMRRYPNRPNPGHLSGRYKDNGEEEQFKDEGEERQYKDQAGTGKYRDQKQRRRYLKGPDGRNRPRLEEVSDVASLGFEDTREAVSGMLVDMTRRRKDGSCKEVKRNGMSCLRCSDSKGKQTEECAYAGGEPSGRHTSYSSSSSYGSQPQQPEEGRDTSYGSSSSYGSQPRQPEGGRDTSYSSSSSYGSQPRQPEEGRDTSYSSSSSYGSQPRQPEGGRDTSYSSSSSYGSQPRHRDDVNDL